MSDIRDVMFQADLEMEEEALVTVAPGSSGLSKKRWAVPGAAAVMLLGAAAVILSKSGSSPAQAMPEMHTVLAAAECSGLGTDCSSTKCCKAGGHKGYQCYQKHDHWAECLEECTPGVHPGEKEGTYNTSGVFQPVSWSCKKLGEKGDPDPCSAPGEDCRQTKCCSSAFGGNGMTCFEKDETYATCRETCDHEKDWSCKALGERTKWDAGCTWAGESCAEQHLCCNQGFVCAVKDESWTTCFQTKKKSSWVTTNIPIPSTWDGTILGGGRTEYSVPAAAEGEKVAGTSLYCFMAYLPGSYEVSLMLEAKQDKASVFACDGYDTFHSWQSQKAGWDTGEATLSNTDVFIDVWKHMVATGKYLEHDWTVKVDADAVLLPDRLKSHLAALRPPAYRPLYIKNNAMDPGMGNSGFLGAVEVFSKQAVQIYADNYEGCHKTLGIAAGEDGFFKGCMDALGVGFMTDPQLFNPDKSAGACNLGQRAAFHPLKTSKDWKCCLDITKGINHKVDYGVCDLPGYVTPTEPPAPKEQD